MRLAKFSYRTCRKRLLNSTPSTSVNNYNRRSRNGVKLKPIKLSRYFKRYFNNPKILLAAPTGRASRRMEEVTGPKAQTIHRLIGTGEVDADVLIIDEMSMVDIELLPIH